jgi:hypothetical protein
MKNPNTTENPSKPDGEARCSVATGSALSDRIKIYERRKIHAEQSLRFWMREADETNDDHSLVQMNRAHRTLGDVNEQLHKLRQPGCIVLPNPPVQLRP